MEQGETFKFTTLREAEEAQAEPQLERQARQARAPHQLLQERVGAEAVLALIFSAAQVEPVENPEAEVEAEGVEKTKEA